MANMSYCSFQNTLSDLKDCVNTLEDYPTLDPDEYEALLEMIEACNDIISLSKRATEEEEEDYDE